ncbi:MAG: hypothetical protein KKC80_03670 [Candidatus Margulisbacteria bacterium]|nr:hypothetical protein [Candidatus Margulisiibacteriota bacterium]MBU1617435.1 hypothetical protein [Candidatus Margulisiibacteriota bacterium]
MQKMRHGVALLLVIIIGGTLLALGVITARIVYNTLWTTRALFDKERAYWLASGGLELASARIDKNHAWFTDMPPPSGNIKAWLAGSAIGERFVLGRGEVKVVREREGGRVYSIGCFSQARAFICGELIDGNLENRKEL